LFFTQEEMARVRAALNLFARYAAGHGRNAGSETEDFLNELTGTKKTALSGQYYYPQFFLEELVYHSPGNWMVRINNQYFGPNTAPADSRLRVEAIDADKVVLEWRPAQMGLIDKSWDRASNGEVVVNDGNGTVTFTLHPNQTFSSYVMCPLEGKVAPVAVGSGTGFNLNVPDEKTVVATPSMQFPPAAAPPPGDQGLSGLINAYKQGGMRLEPSP
ncbi:MAG: hypothetical protein KGI29_08335, partial [Pseudomonadota bacterium]|nr:hypothetical protein [Pseudomonadota bacterium]